MRCEKCGYDMDALDRECRRCRMLSQRSEPDQVSESAEEQAPATDDVRHAVETPPASSWAKPTVVGVALGASIVSRSLYPSVWAYVVWVPAAVLGLWCGYGMVARARPVRGASDGAGAGPQWRFGGLLLITVMLALNFPAASRHVEDPVVDVQVLQSGAVGPPPAPTWDGSSARGESRAHEATATALRTSPQASEYLAAAGRAQMEGDSYAQAALDESWKAQRLREEADTIEAEPMRRSQERQTAHSLNPSELGSSGDEEARAEQEAVRLQRERAEAIARANSVRDEAFKHECSARDYEAMGQKCNDQAKRYRALAGWDGP